PSGPIMVMYIHGIGRIPADPHGAAERAPTAMPDGSGASTHRPTGPASGTTGWPGRNGARWDRTHTGPTPGPPPPWGMQNVLCRFRCDTSPPNRPGAASPTNAFRLAPSTYTWPPWRCTRSQIGPIASSNTPCVDGYVTINAASRSE